MCYALVGDNRYHSIFGAVSACVAVNPAILPGTVALNATIKTSKREIACRKFLAVKYQSLPLDDDEIVTEIQVPAFSGKSAFVKFAMRSSIDFPIVSCAAAIDGSNARICLNAVHNNPYRVTCRRSLSLASNHVTTLKRLVLRR
jgi:xanthine dehydrogenase YagS FAD-binding subunit